MASDIQRATQPSQKAEQKDIAAKEKPDNCTMDNTMEIRNLKQFKEKKQKEEKKNERRKNVVKLMERHSGKAVF